MKLFQLVFMDGYDEVRDLNTQDVVFSTKISEELQEYLNRPTMNNVFVDEVVNIWNKTESLEEVDEYLLNEGLASQEEREIVVESIFTHMDNKINQKQ